MSTKKPTGGKSSPAATSNDDPPPVPPERPAPDECCNSGCIPCVYDLYDEAMDRYREALKAWSARHEAHGT
ncbi:oxidoreductase-like domain-containing protein [Achromobacter animicus]|uniref:oxidoreductase-like domain-containing protein n=1 Tax=Achromobacter animicus TaxID=1389935 RepID=UPI00244CD67C|nr:oxidoreductase-like domain-containing protein [Achromobacter animicus]MDH0685187.1 oxidoreductase-like domain-containing protein [Achromobacter animicus]